MHFDLATLMAAGAFVASASGLFLLFVWWQHREARSVLWWSISQLFTGAAIALLNDGIIHSSAPRLGIATILLIVGGAISWGAAQVFNRRRPTLIPMALGPFILAAAAFGLSGIAPGTAAPLGMLLVATYYVATAWEIGRAWRFEPLRARLPLAGLALVHALIFVGGAFDIVTGRMAAGARPEIDSWFGLIHFEMLIFSVGTAMFVASLVRERGELKQMLAAGIDALTGVANRGSFVTRSQAAMKQAMAQGLPVAGILFDLDYFKAINDNHGHHYGDLVLQCFAETARRGLRRDDILGRVGGEEFAVILPGAGPEAAAALAERIRVSFAEAAQWFDNKALDATVSAGVAIAGPSAPTLERLLDAADQALYRAKARGRNRVARADDPGEASAEHTNVVRIA